MHQRRSNWYRRFKCTVWAQFRMARTWASNFGSRSNRNSPPHLLHFPAQVASSCRARMTTPHTPFRGIRWRVMATNRLPVATVVSLRTRPDIRTVTSGTSSVLVYEHATIRVRRSRGVAPPSVACTKWGRRGRRTGAELSVCARDLGPFRRRSPPRGTGISRERARCRNSRPPGIPIAAGGTRRAAGSLTVPIGRGWRKRTSGFRQAGRARPASCPPGGKNTMERMDRRGVSWHSHSRD